MSTVKAKATALCEQEQEGWDWDNPGLGSVLALLATCLRILGRTPARGVWALCWGACFTMSAMSLNFSFCYLHSLPLPLLLPLKTKPEFVTWI